MFLEDDSGFHDTHYLLERLFEEFRNASRNEALILLGISLSGVAVVFAPWHVQFVWVPLPERRGALVIDFHLLAHYGELLIGIDILPGKFEVARNVKVTGVIHADYDV